ncbi:hypothetical protein D1224_14910 [Henriciella barbarensis]|uniref:DUF2306 domain-containing protein n=1 Tax=Henriciella barbarensis TaxID=86342 RepID=A0A399QRW8_9PROT|nr:hypothetical protein [Henriciella barbarensis]RIJ20412.1 hypothetical protein D1224_14910 [Henriciella barbarensis]
MMTILMLLHIIAGTAAVAAGGPALALRKGSPLHRASGLGFVVSMVISALAGTILAGLKPEFITLLAGFFTIYLVLSSWMTMQGWGQGGGVVAGGCLVPAVLIATVGGIWGTEALASPDGLKTGYSAEPYLVFAAIVGLAGLGDLSVIVRKGIRGRQRTARHLWRMSLALFIAVGSLFTGPGSSIFPQSIRDTGLLSLPELLVLSLMVFWLIRVFVGRELRARSPVSRPALKMR